MRPIALLSMLAAISACNNQPASTSDVKIVSGTSLTANDEAARSTVALIINGNEGQELCSATLIGPQQLVTAAHCVDGQDPRNITVVFSTDADPYQGETRQATGAARNPNFNYFGAGSPDGEGPGGPGGYGPGGYGPGGYGLADQDGYGPEAASNANTVINGTSDNGQTASTKVGDIGIIVFDQPAPASYVPVAVAPPSAIASGTDILLAGFGAIAQNQQGAGTLRQTTAHVDRICTGSANADGSGCSDGEFIQRNEGHGTCNGDSGGPVFVREGGGSLIGGTGALQVVGATSRGDDCDVGNGTYTFVSAYQGWMKCTFDKLGQPLTTLADDASSADCATTQVNGAGGASDNNGNASAPSTFSGGSNAVPGGYGPGVYGPGVYGPGVYIPVVYGPGVYGPVVYGPYGP